jgi:hypothetical protein
VERISLATKFCRWQNFTSTLRSRFANCSHQAGSSEAAAWAEKENPANNKAATHFPKAWRKTGNFDAIRVTLIKQTWETETEFYKVFGIKGQLWGIR